MDLFNLINAPNPSKVKNELRPRTAHEVLLLTATVSWVIDMEDPDMATESSGTPFAIEKSSLDFNNENPSPPTTKVKGTEGQAYETVAPEIPPPGNMPTTGATSEVSLEEEVVAMGARLSKNVVEWEIDLLPIHGWVTRRYLSARMRRDQQLPPGHPGRMPRCFRSHNATWEVQGLQNHTSNLKTLLEAEAGMKKAAKAKNADLTKELESLCTQFLDLQVSNDQLTQQVSTLQTQVTGEELLLRSSTNMKMIGWRSVVRRWMPVWMRMSEGLAHGIEHGKADRDLEVVEAYDPVANSKFLQTLQELKDLKYPIVDQLKGLKDAPIEVIMVSLQLESDSGEDAPKWIHVLRPSTSQLKILVYPEVRDPKDPWAVKEEMLLEEAIAANVSRAKKKKRCRVVCRTHGVGSAHHGRSDSVPVSVPTVAPQGLAILLEDAVTQIETSEDDASPRFLRSKSLSPMYNLDWPYANPSMHELWPRVRSRRSSSKSKFSRSSSLFCTASTAVVRYDSDCDELDSAKITLMANLSHYGFDNLAKQLEPKLYDGSVIQKTDAIVIHDSEETLMLEDESRSKMLQKQKDSMMSEKKYSVNSEEPNLSSSTTIVEVPKELPKVSMVNSSLKKLKFHLANFDVVVKERTITTAITEGMWVFKHTKACFRDEIIPFVKALKELFNSFDQFLIDELIEVQNVFNQMEQVVEQHCVEKNKFQDKMNDVLKENERLLKQAISVDIVNIVVHANVNSDCKIVNECERCVIIETELQKDFIKKECYDTLFKQYTTLEKHCISLESQEKDTVIMKLKERIKSLSGNVKEEKIKRELEEIETINIELDHRVTKLVAENEHVKQTYKQLYDSIKSPRVRLK
uniref:Uncharacterized protein n=1 Tax=Tanacetum cinerariifolium TaxID=118510 RepID=A0A699I6A2_TANCI|nr:hypothetical protein [Tanacetum cinerariifolium]